MDLDEVADHLYGLVPGEFVAARADWVKRAKADDKSELAREIQALRKPTAAAWLTNQLVREHRDAMEPLLELGRELREVMADLSGDELRAMTRQRHQLVTALVQQARQLAKERGVKVTDQVARAVRSTLEATLADPASEHAVASGHLSDALQVTGFGAGDVPPASATPPPETAAGGTVTDLDERRRRKARRQAEHDAQLADEAVRRADTSRRAAERKLADVSQAREKTGATVDRLTLQLERATAELERLTTDEEEASEELDATDEALDEAKETQAQAVSRLEAVDQGKES